MPDGLSSCPGWPFIPPSPGPPTTLWPTRSRPELLLDNQGVFLADPAGNLLGFDTNWGRGGPLSRIVYAQRNSTRDL